MNTEYLTIEDVAKILKINKRGVARLVKMKKIKHLKPSPRKTLFTLEMVENYANRI